MPEDTGLDYASTIDGTMHACGHDAHVAMLVGAARVLAAKRDQLAGTIRFMFQPGEEGFTGAQYMIDEGVLERPTVDAAFALHVAPNLPTGTVWTRRGALMASADVIDILVTGKGGHASTPYLANDPMHGRGRDRPEPADLRDAPHRHLRPRRDHHHVRPRGHDDQRHPRDRAPARHRARGVTVAVAGARSKASSRSPSGSQPRTRCTRS